MGKETTNQQISLEEFKKQAEKWLQEVYPNLTEGKEELLKRIEEDSEEFWEDKWSPQAMMTGISMNLV